MPAVKYIVDLTREERDSLQRLIRRAKPAARQPIRARGLPKADQGLTDEEIATALEVGTATGGRIRQRLVEEGLARALKERPRPGQRPKLSGKQEAHWVAVACSTAPAGHARWTLRLLADKAVQCGLAASLSPEVVRQILTKTTSSRGRSSRGVSRR